MTGKEIESGNKVGLFKLSDHCRSGCHPGAYGGHQLPRLVRAGRPWLHRRFWIADDLPPSRYGDQRRVWGVGGRRGHHDCGSICRFVQ